MFVESMKAARSLTTDETPQSVADPVTGDSGPGPEIMVFELTEDAKSEVAGGCNRVLLDLSGPGLGGLQDARMVGDWQIAIDAAGRFDIVRVHASLDGLCVNLHDPESGAVRLFDTGRLALSLTDATALEVDSGQLADFGPLNSGRIDRFSGIVRLTWAVRADSDALAAAGIDPLAAIVPMIGCFEPETGALTLAGVGEVLHGPLAGAKIQVTTKQKTTFKIDLDAPDDIKKDSKGNATAKLTVKLIGTPQGDVKVGFSARFSGSRSTSASFKPDTVTLKKNGDEASTTVSITKARSSQTAYFTASGGGKTGKDESIVQ